MAEEKGLVRLRMQLFRQLESFFFLSDEEISSITDILPKVIERTTKCFARNENKYYREPDIDGGGGVNPYHSGKYTVFLYYLSNSLSKQGDTLVADKIYYLNKIMNACDLYHQVDLPDFFMLDHPVGSVMGRAKYSDGLSFAQNCTVGNNRGIYPTLGRNVRMCAGASIIGNCRIGNNVILGAGTMVKDENIPDDSLVFGQSPNLIIKPRTL